MMFHNNTNHITSAIRGLLKSRNACKHKLNHPFIFQVKVDKSTQLTDILLNKYLN